MDILGQDLVQGVCIVLEGISKKGTDPSMYSSHFDCLFKCNENKVGEHSNWLETMSGNPTTRSTDNN